MTALPNLAVIRNKKQELLASAARHEDLAAKDRAEAAELASAERVWIKLFGKDGDLLHDDEQPQGEEAADEKPISPPVTEMIIEALKDAQDKGSPGLQPVGIASYIQQKYWKGARTRDVGSTAWRMWKDGRLSKPEEGSSIYALAPQIRENAAGDIILDGTSCEICPQ